MNFTRLALGLALPISITTLGGCYGGPDVPAEVGDTSEEARTSRAWENLVGAWQGDLGVFRGLVFTATPEGAGRHFFADVDNGVRCVRAPCPSEARIEGVLTATSRALQLRLSDPSVTVPGLLGGYNYTLRGDVLTFTAGGRAVARLRRVASYCAAGDDCAEQRLTTPSCVGVWSCSAARACNWTCITRCATVRCSATTHCVDNGTSARCVPNGPSCAAIRCASGYVCRDTDGVGACVRGVACGTAVCGAGTYCCNPLRSLCAPTGYACIQ